ncbi:MAG: hypothetical protein N2544_17065, partial [Burkholderiales bacterium]|nr:hypothetical protein [Burkholderiales bacterium]
PGGVAGCAAALTTLTFSPATSPPDDRAAPRRPPPRAREPLAPRLEGTGAYTRDTGSSVRFAQRSFDRARVLAWGFNAAEAARR